MLKEFMDAYGIPLKEDDGVSSDSQGTSNDLGTLPTVGLGVVATNYQPDLIVDNSTGREDGSQKDISQGLCMKCGRPLFAYQNQMLCYYCDHIGDAQQVHESKKTLVLEVSKLRHRILK